MTIPTSFSRVLSKSLQAALSATLPFAVTPAAAAPGPLAQAPLYASASADPNIMLLIDNSGSMNNIVPDAPYDPEVIFACVTGVVASGSQMDIRITSDGDPYFRVDDATDYDFGTAGGTGVSGRSRACFDPDLDYAARLHGDSGADTETKTASGYLDAQYTGNYLNWYFGSSPTNWGSGARLKPGTQTRMAIAKETAKSLVNDTLDDVRVGLASYDGGNGAHINVGVDAIDANRATLASEIDGLTPSGSTPLAESLHDIGRYFVGFGGATNPGHQTTTGIVSNGQYEGSLTLHPGATNESTTDDDTVFDHSPVLASGVSNESPIAYFCQTNFTVLLTDGRPESDQAINADTGLQDYDGDCVDADPACGDHDQKPDQEYESAGSDYLDDVAKALFEMDLRPDIDDLDGNEVVNNLRTYTIGFADDQVINDPLMQDTANNGGGQFLRAANADALKSAFETTVAAILEHTGSAAAVTFNAGSLSANSVVYLSLFNSRRWSGQLLAYPLDGLTGSVMSTPTWDAAVVLDNRDISGTPRTVLSYDGSDGVPFQWTSLSLAQQLDLCSGSAACIDDNATPADPSDDVITTSTEVAEARLAYLRGDRSDEGSGHNFRLRSSRLGDIVHSGPVFVGPPELEWPDTAPFPEADGETYQDFKEGSAKNRTKLVYVGANDGMLHGFRADTGAEVLAYIPGNLFSSDNSRGLHHLTEASYSHRFYVDLEPAVFDAYVKTSDLGSVGWHTVLIGGERGGGRGYFALDVTDPSAFSEANAADIVMWEFTSQHDADLGHTFSAPVVALMENGRWAVIFGNGYEDTGSGEAKLFVLYLDGGLDGSWDLGTDYLKISTGVGDTTNRNGLSTPGVVDMDGNGAADRAYAGDLEGNMWAFDLSATNDNGWEAAYQEGGTPKPLFTAASNQPITSKPILIKHPTVGNEDSPSNAPNVLVLFGTGQYLVEGDKDTTHQQSFYGVWDEGTRELDRNDLVEQTFESGFAATLRVVSDNDVPYTAGDASKRYGWYMDLPESGERAVVSPGARGDVVFFNTLIPSNGICEFGGSGWLMAVSTANGGRPDTAPFDVNGDNSVNESDLVSNSDDSLVDAAVAGERFSGGIPAESAFLSSYQYTPGSSTSSGDEIHERAIESLENPFTGRLSWEELQDD